MDRSAQNNTLLASLLSEYASSGFNIFFGAGVSRDAPTNGPIWTEMQRGFLLAIFDRMAEACWPIAERFVVDREAISKLDIRPETFWRLVSERVGVGAVAMALQSAGKGDSNENHVNIGRLLGVGMCRTAVTTNFDEHLEAVLPSSVNVAILHDSLDLPAFAPGQCQLVKLHGSLSSEVSLAYTLEQYDLLKSRNSAVLERCLSGRPLIIAGYSGNDTDVFPVLRKLLPQLPLAVIIRHPGSPSSEPVLGLTAAGSNVRVLEASCGDVLAGLAQGIDLVLSPKPRLKEKAEANFYAAATHQIRAPFWPLLLMDVFRFAVDTHRSQVYGWLAHDAACDARYRPQLEADEYRKLHMTVGECLHLMGDHLGSRIMFAEAEHSLDEDGGSVSEAMQRMAKEAALREAPGFVAPIRSANRPSGPWKASEVYDGMCSMDKIGISLSSYNDFENAWQIGVLKRREGDPGAAVSLFASAAELLTKYSVPRLESGRFLLDYGSATFELALKEKSDSWLSHSNVLFQLSIKLAEQAGDWRTSAAAALMLAKVTLFDAGPKAALTVVHSASESCRRTGDNELLKRINEFTAYIGTLPDVAELGDP